MNRNKLSLVILLVVSLSISLSSCKKTKLGTIAETGERTVRELGANHESESKALDSLLHTCKWLDDASGFSYPSFMTVSDEEGNNNITHFYLYSWHNVVLSCFYCPFDATVPGSEIAPGYHIKDVSFKSTKQGLTSGSTDGGFTYYLKQMIQTDNDNTYARMLALIYPPYLEEQVEPLIKRVQSRK